MFTTHSSSSENSVYFESGTNLISLKKSDVLVMPKTPRLRPLPTNLRVDLNLKLPYLLPKSAKHSEFQASKKTFAEDSQLIYK